MGNRWLMSASPPKADKEQASWVCPLCANSDRTQRSKKSLLNHLVGAREQRRRYVEAKRLCGCGLYPAGPAAILHWPDPIMIVAEPSLVVELA